MHDSMLDPGKARWFGKAHGERGGPVPATIAELTALCLFAPPCCGHIALCDGACRDARPDDAKFADARFAARSGPFSAGRHGRFAEDDRR